MVKNRMKHLRTVSWIDLLVRGNCSLITGVPGGGYNLINGIITPSEHSRILFLLMVVMRTHSFG